MTIELSCAPAGTPCPRAGATLTVTAAARVPLPLVPPVFGGTAPAVPVSASAVQKVSRFWSER